jgi:hypothetical protein
VARKGAKPKGVPGRAKADGVDGVPAESVKRSDADDLGEEESDRSTKIALKRPKTNISVRELLDTIGGSQRRAPSTGEKKPRV